MVDISNYESLRDDADKFYRTIGRVQCPALKNEFVHFNSEGFNHLVYKSNRSERSRADQITKFKQLGRAVQLIRITTTYQEYEETLKEFSVKRFKKRVQESKVVRYWGFIAILNGWKIKTIVRQIGDGQKHFWSVIPAWTTNQYRDLKLVSHMKGDPEDD